MNWSALNGWSISQPALWLVAGLALSGAEMLLPGVFLLWIGLAACGTGVLSAVFAFGWHLQIGGFVVLALALVGAVALRKRHHTPVDAINAPAAGLVGGLCYAVAFEAGEGRVRFRDGTWLARVTDGIAPGEGAPMRVVGLDGTTLLVAALR